MIDILIYKKDKVIRHSSNMTWDYAHHWLYEVERKLLEDYKTFDKIEINLFSEVFTKKSGKQAMPFRNFETDNFTTAHNYLTDMLIRLANNEFEGVWIG